MVVRTRISRPQPTKREPDWDMSSPMDAPLSFPSQIPFAHYAMIYMDNVGSLRISTSQSISQSGEGLFTQDIRNKFIEIVQSHNGSQMPVVHKSPRDLHRTAGNSHDDAVDVEISPRPGKRRRCSSAEDPSSSGNWTTLRIGDSSSVYAFYAAAFRRFHQGNCRVLAKEWIRFIEPKKQVRYPYKGDRETGDPELTKPPWWPAGVLHKEPDHVRTEPRVRLLIHILCNLGRSNATAKNLKEVADSARRRLNPSKIRVLDEIFRVRMLQERYEHGEVDASLTIHVYNGLCSKSDKDHDSDDAEEGAENDETGGTGETSVPPTISTRSMHVPSHVPYGAGTSQGEFYPVTAFENERQPTASFYSTADYSDSSPVPSTVDTPATSVSSPYESRNCDYTMPTGFYSPPVEDQIHIAHRQVIPLPHQPNQAELWAQPFRHGMLSPVEYGVSQTMPHQSFGHHGPITASPGPGLGLSRVDSLPDMSRTRAEMDGRNVYFRTGSLGHPTIAAPLDHSVMTSPNPIY